MTYEIRHPVHYQSPCGKQFIWDWSKNDWTLCNPTKEDTMHDEFFSERQAMRRALHDYAREKISISRKRNHIDPIRAASFEDFQRLFAAGKFEKFTERELKDHEEYGFCPHMIRLREHPADEKAYDADVKKIRSDEDAIELKINVLPPVEALPAVEGFRPSVH